MARVRYVCEACAAEMEEVEMVEQGIDNQDLASLTLVAQGDIIEKRGKGDVLLVPSLCEECIEALVSTDTPGEG